MNTHDPYDDEWLSSLFDDEADLPTATSASGAAVDQSVLDAFAVLRSEIRDVETPSDWLDQAREHALERSARPVVVDFARQPRERSGRWMTTLVGAAAMVAVAIVGTRLLQDHNETSFTAVGSQVNAELSDTSSATPQSAKGATSASGSGAALDGASTAANSAATGSSGTAARATTAGSSVQNLGDFTDLAALAARYRSTLGPLTPDTQPSTSTTAASATQATPTTLDDQPNPNCGPALAIARVASRPVQLRAGAETIDVIDRATCVIIGQLPR